MSRAAIFIDAGYVVASAAELLTGSPERRGVRVDLPELLTALQEEIGQRAQLPLLRTYWYDASPTGQPERDQQVLADVPGVNLRLGRLVRGEQKGVDSRIVRDMIVLSQGRGLSDMVLVAGDEDLVEGVREAQDNGVRVALLGVPGVNQSRLLQQQADVRYELDESFWAEHFQPVEESAPRRAAVPAQPRTSASPAMVEAFERAASQNPGAAQVLMQGLAEEGVAFEQAAGDAGAAFARELIEVMAPPELDRLLMLTGWQVPQDIDRRLMPYAERRLGVLWERRELKTIVRSGFWRVIRNEGAELQRQRLRRNGG